MLGSGDDEPLLIFTARDVLECAMQTDPLVGATWLIRPLRYEIGIVGEKHFIERANSGAFDIKVDAAALVEAQVAKQVGPSRAVRRIDLPILGQHPGSIGVQDELRDLFVRIQPIVPSWI